MALSSGRHTGKTTILQALQDLKVGDFTTKESKFHLVVMGDSGAGKTSFVGGITPNGPLTPALFIDLEGGTTSVAATAQGIDGVRYTAPTNYEQLLAISEVLGWDDDDPQKPEDFVGLKTIIIDSLTSMSTNTVADVSASPLAPEKSKTPFRSAQSDYLISQNMIMSILRKAKNAGLHIIATASIDKREGSIGGMNLPRGLKDQLQLLMSYIWEMETLTEDNTTYHLLFTQQAYKGDGIKTRNTHVRQALLEESAKAYKALGRTGTGRFRGSFVLADPLDDVQPANQYTMEDLFLIWQKALDIQDD